MSFEVPSTQTSPNVVLPAVDLVAARVHAFWVAEKRAAGVTSRPSAVSGCEQLVEFDQLDERDKESNRAMVRTVYAAISGLGVAVL